jgi:hypothetical protein
VVIDDIRAEGTGGNVLGTRDSLQAALENGKSTDVSFDSEFATTHSFDLDSCTHLGATRTVKRLRHVPFRAGVEELENVSGLDVAKGFCSPFIARA